MAQSQSDAEHDGRTEEGESRTEEGESLTSTRREGWWRPLYLFGSTRFTPEGHKSATLVQAQFQPRADDIILATFPKCGTTWLKAPMHTSSTRMASVRISTYSLKGAFELFIEGVSFAGPIWEHYLGYWKQSVIEPGRVLFLKYDEMMADPTKHVKMLAEFLRVPFTDEEESATVPEEVVRLCSFDNLKGLPVNSTGISNRNGLVPLQNSAYFRSGKVGDWRNHMTEEMAKKMDLTIEEKLQGSGLSF